MTATRALLPFVALLLGLSACKQEQQDPSIDSGLPADKQATELTPAEQTQYCEAVGDFAASLITPAEAKRAACTFEGILASLAMFDGTVDACVTVRDGCLDKPDETTGGDGTTCDLGIDWATCMASIAELEACHEENRIAVNDGFTSLDCAKMPEYKAQMPSQDPPPLGEACSLAKAKCATVLGGGTP